MGRRIQRFFLIILLSIVAISQFPLQISNKQPIKIAVAHSPNYLSHILGGFSINTPQKALKAASDGMQVTLQYDPPPSSTDMLGQKLQSLQMRVIDGYISNYLYYYECHRTKTVKPPPPGQQQYCQNDVKSSMADENTLLASIAEHLQQMQDNQLIIGYWILDDWAPWDAGGARQILTKIHDLIQKYTPGRPAICGFGGFILLDHVPGWDDRLADNFSPRGCDMVGLYVYTPDIANTNTRLSSDTFDWSMSEVLPLMLASLRKRGWKPAKEPLLGIGQVFGGPIAQTHSHWLIPSAKNIETQSKSFC